MRNELLIWCALATWLGSSAIGFGIWQDYESTPGAAAAPDQPPAAPAAERPRVTVYLHPHCPCSRATLAELTIALEDHPADAAVEIVFVLPPGVAAGWECGELWDRAAALPHAQLRVDVDGVEARAAGATTSGTVIYANAAGEIVFRGGITRGRGARGENSGRCSLEARLGGREPGVPQTPIFGCPLAAPPGATTPR